MENNGVVWWSFPIPSIASLCKCIAGVVVVVENLCNGIRLAISRGSLVWLQLRNVDKHDPLHSQRLLKCNSSLGAQIGRQVRVVALVFVDANQKGVEFLGRC